MLTRTQFISAISAIVMALVVAGCQKTKTSDTLHTPNHAAESAVNAADTLEAANVADEKQPDNVVANLDALIPPNDAASPDEYCASKGLVFRRTDGRCAAEAFELVYDAPIIEIPTALAEKCDFVIDWGDGASEKVPACPVDDQGKRLNLKHSYSAAGEHHVKITGIYDGWSLGWDVRDGENVSPIFFNSAIVRVVSFGPVGLGKYAFAKQNLTSVSSIDIPDASKLTSCKGMFWGEYNNAPCPEDAKCEAKFIYLSKLNDKSLTYWDMSNVTDMSYMFVDAVVFNQPIGNWNTANVTDMSYMFMGARSFNQPIESWNTANVTNMRGVFNGASSFNQPIGNWNTANVTNMGGMFMGASSFNQPIGNWNTANVTNMGSMFAYVPSFNQPIGDWNTANVTDMSSMLQAARSFNQPIGNWNTANVTNMREMFYGASSFNQPIGDWNTGSVIDMHMMFCDASSFNQPIGDWNVQNVNRMEMMFRYAKSFDQPIGNWKISTFPDIDSMFEGATAFKQDISSWKKSNH